METKHQNKISPKKWRDGTRGLKKFIRTRQMIKNVYVMRISSKKPSMIGSLTRTSHLKGAPLEVSESPG